MKTWAETDRTPAPRLRVPVSGMMKGGRGCMVREIFYWGRATTEGALGASLSHRAQDPAPLHPQPGPGAEWFQPSLTMWT